MGFRCSIIVLAACLTALEVHAQVRVLEIQGETPTARAGIRSEYVLTDTDLDPSTIIVVMPGGQTSEGAGLSEAAMIIVQRERQWSKAPEMIPIDGPPIPPVSDYGMASNGSTAFLLGGLEPETGELRSAGEIFTMEVNPDGAGDIVLTTSVLSPQGPGPGPRFENPAAWIDKPKPGIVTCGGFGGDDQLWSFLDDCWRYELDSDTWIPGPDLPHPMSGHDIIPLNDDQFLAIGWGPDFPPGEIATVVCDWVEGACEAITTAGEVPPPTYGHHVDVIYRTIQGQPVAVMVGGNDWRDNSFRSNISIIHLESGTWKSADFALPRGLSKFGAALIPSTEKIGATQMIVFGGAEEWFPPVYSDTAYEIEFGGFEAAADLAVPAVARVQGVGTFFTSTMHLFNAGQADLELEIVFTPRQGSPGSIASVRHTVPAGILQTIDDPVGTLFMPHSHADRVGSLLISAISGSATDLVAQTVVVGRLDTGEEYGQIFPATEMSHAIGTGQVAYLNTTEDPAANRVNVGLMAAADGTRFRVMPVDPLGTGLANPRTYDLDLGENVQINRVHDAFGIASRADVVIEVEVEAGAGFAYSSVLDGTTTHPGTSDPTTIASMLAGSERVTLLEIGSIQGINEFSGSGSITNVSTRPAAIRADFHQRDIPGVTATRSLTLTAGDTMGSTDLVGSLFGVFGAVGTVVLTTTNGTRIGATGREFAVFRDERGEVTGTAGQLIAGQTDLDRLQPGWVYHCIGLKQQRTAQTVERSHVAAFNPGSLPAEITIRLVDGATGRDEGRMSWTIDPGTIIHVNNLIRRINPDHDAEEKRIEVEVTQPVFLNAFRVNRWGDPVTLTAHRARSSGVAISGEIGHRPNGQ
jgi:hypothetical protein